ncbi:hypothetical protein GCM10011581_20490 [Saccharopolyspora subtropica]|uniref:Uncharacterized protein n=1 Tax=Saccharopolyspora thermophila TaxID=89367 RepID=A0A917JT04_9PSEU|nr:hypothetical protein [Saccharopolyspora subtropica]GGI83141.1 hypothetical protein GCM10011581_20490 [Saccharopolyspora subtropica]
MQTWAKRGVQAALVTGGMLAVGTGVAAASETCPERPTAPLGESVLPPALDELGDEAAHSGRCLAGELLRDDAGQRQHNAPLVASRADHSQTALRGTLDPVHDLLPAIENERTREFPALREVNWLRPTEPLHLAGWVADPAAARPLEPGLPPIDGRRPVTPAEGFHRSLSWAGPIGEVIQGGAGTLDEGAFRTGAVLDVPADLVIPHDDLVYFDGFADRPGGIVDLWEGVLTGGRGLVSAEQVDLTSAELPGLRNEVHTVPTDVVVSALSAFAAPPAPRPDVVPLQVPGEHQMQAHEVPDLNSLPIIEVSQTQRFAPRTESPGVSAPLPVLGNLNALRGGQTAVPQVNRIAAALEGAQPRSRVARTGGLPVLGGVPDITAAQGETLLTPGVTPNNGVLRTLSDADTVVFDRIS